MKDKAIKIPVGEKCSHHKNPRPLYIEWHADAERRHENGEEQKECIVCRHWFWKDEI